ncbi:MBL fold metallo-hydrolase [Aquabacterium sp. A7-Y]|uniref:MBL fold metallo-hydrolase n=1 Tax=Aquabacterium sp. A7-Y TaxID=1349605 RepID=UPI00223E7C76|nr:MBL fold metallo-hydrolase [Aquabacterium sp. A7-Y]MCW7538214.1 MBL fold metallo-hydrolase [Aquabacterium sp. A7-Y]
MRFCSLGSGSTGNATLIEASGGITQTRVLVDCGFSLRELERRLARVGLGSDDLDAVFITHEHSDHVGCALALAKRRAIPVWTSAGTWKAMGEPELGPLLHRARDGVAIDLGDLCITPYAVPHDALEPLQLTCSDGHAKLGILTDAGSSTSHLLTQLQACSALLLEANHDPEMLQRSRYPAFLKARIAGRHGHLANDAAAEILRFSAHLALKHVVAAHLSQQNNTPQHAALAFADALGCSSEDIVVAKPDTGFHWLDA